MDIVDAVSREPVRARILLHHLSGSMDAGAAGRLAIEQLIPTLPHERIVTFNSDALIDYRARRPIITLDNWAITDIDTPVIALDKVRDYSGEDVLVLHGPEPDLRWEEFSDLIVEIAKEAGVEMAISMFGLPASTPHTRPPVITQTGSRPDLVPPQEPSPGMVQFSASIGTFLQAKLGKQEIDAIGLAVGVPYYVMENDYPAAGAALISRISDLTGLELPVGDLEAAAAALTQKLVQEVENSDEIEHMISGLEDRMDAISRPEVVSEAEPMPSGDELAERFENFLRVHEQVKDSDNLTPPPAPPRGGGRHRKPGPVDGPTQLD